MSIPEHVKKQALAAVNHEATARTWLYSNQGASAAPRKPESTDGIPEHLRKLSMDATADKTTLAELKFIEMKGYSFRPLPTPRIQPGFQHHTHIHHWHMGKDDLER